MEARIENYKSLLETRQVMELVLVKVGWVNKESLCRTGRTTVTKTDGPRTELKYSYRQMENAPLSSLSQTNLSNLSYELVSRLSQLDLHQKRSCCGSSLFVCWTPGEYASLFLGAQGLFWQELFPTIRGSVEICWESSGSRQCVLGINLWWVAR